MTRAIQELKALHLWVRQGTGYDRDDARDEIARAIWNRICDLEREQEQDNQRPTDAAV